MENKYADLSLDQLWDLLEAKEEYLQQLEEEPINYYIPGDSMTYMSAMSQCWGIEMQRDEIREIEAEMSRRCSANNEKEE